MSKPAKPRRNKKPTKPAAKKPRKRTPLILVLEGAGGSATSAVRRSGATAVRVNPRDIAAVDEALARPFHGLLLTGGGDLDPRLYGEKPHKQVYGVSETRDYTEWTALDRAAELRVPVMGICRGMQLIAVHNGGALKQHIDGHRGGQHRVDPEDRTRFGSVVGAGRHRFPSLHHQVVRRHGGNGMRVAARSPEGYIEAIENRRVLAVQFHPEYDYNTNEASRRLFDWLAAAAARRARLPKPTRVKVAEVHRNYGRCGPQLPIVPRKVEKRPAGTSRYESRWLCRDCGMEFDKRQDRDDHEVWVCRARQEMDAQLTLTEPPPGHPDWEDAELVTLRSRVRRS